MPGSNLAEPAARPRLPEWLRIRLPMSDRFAHTRALLGELKLHTVCESARCPNHWECWEKGTATFMIGGDRCTGLAVFARSPPPNRFRWTLKNRGASPRPPGVWGSGTSSSRPMARDDLADGGAGHFAGTIRAVRAVNPGIVIEVLTPDFNEREADLEAVLSAQPHIFNHNLETVRRLTPAVRSRATYDRSLRVLGKVKAKRGHGIYTKSGLMLGLGETEAEVHTALANLRRVGCDLLTLGQYLQPSLEHIPVSDFITPAQFDAYGQRARALGFVHVASGPMVRSSYHADEFDPGSVRMPSL